MTADPYIDRHYDGGDPHHPGVAVPGYGDGWGDESTPTVPQKARRRMPPKRDLAVQALTAGLDRTVPLFVAIPTAVLVIGLAHWLPVGVLLKAGWIVGYALVAVAAGFQLVQSNTTRRRALLVLWVAVALGTCWMVAS